MRHYKTALLFTLSLYFSSFTHANDIFDELEMETGGCTIALKQQQSELTLAKQQLTEQTAEFNRIQLQLEQSQQANQAKITALKSTINKQQNTPTCKTTPQPNRQDRDKLITLQTHYDALALELKETKAKLAYAEKDKAVLSEKVASLAHAATRAKEKEHTAEKVNTLRQITNNVTTKLADINTNSEETTTAWTKPIYIGPVAVSTHSCKKRGPIIKCKARMTSIDGFVKTRIRVTSANIKDTAGNRYIANQIKIGSNISKTGNSAHQKLTEGKNTDIEVTFYGIQEETTALQSFTFHIYGGADSGNVTANDIPLMLSE